MTATVIILIILGIAFIFASYAFAEKLSKKDEDSESVIKIPTELTEEQKAKIKKLIDDYMDENVDGKMSDIEAKLSEIVNNKTLALGDYAVTVNEEIERNHNEVMFLYSMLSDKQKEIMNTAVVVDEYRKDVEAFVEKNNLTNVQIEHQEEQILEEEINNIEEESSSDTEETPVDSNKDIILEMHKSGLSILEIAKHLGLGVGEVKLVVDLYQGESK
ncbi:MAG: hypothetical protein J6J16_01135 [Lachnospiraceae bacterium]|nr:hypothetical protein [Lachnospiraceae bacterium]